MPVQDFGLDEMFADLRAEAGAGGSYALEVSNPTEYAAYVQDREGYSVIDEDHLLATVEAAARELAASSQPVTERNVLLALEKAGFDEVAHLRSLTLVDGEMRHPGHWVDRTGQLANGYRHEVQRT